MKFIKSYNIAPPQPIKNRFFTSTFFFSPEIDKVMVKEKFMLNVKKSYCVCVSGYNKSAGGGMTAKNIYFHSVILKMHDGEYWLSSDVLSSQQIEELINNDYLIKYENMIHLKNN